MPQKVVKGEYAGREGTYYRLYPENVNQLTCTAKKII
jgi:hypothetical protein